MRPAPDGSDIRLLMTLHPFVAIFMALWLCGIGAPIVTALLQGPQAGVPAIPAGMFVFGVLLTVGGFYVEARKADARIRECLCARGSDLGE